MAYLQFKSGEVPESVATCPECGAKLIAQDVWEWEADTGVPVQGGYGVDCSADQDAEHRHWQMDWQSILDDVHKWVIAQCPASSTEE